MSAPQVVVVVFLAMKFGVHSYNHGEKKELDTFHAGYALLNIGSLVALLWWGGFWEVAS